MINVKLRDDVRQFESGITAIEIAKEISPALCKACCVCRIDGEIKDLKTKITDDCEVEFLTFDDEEGKKAFRHSASHVLAQAVKRLYPEVKLAIGPAVDNGFYYDFDSEFSFTPDVLEKIEAEMKKIVKENLSIEKYEMTPDEAIAFMNEKNETYKRYWINIDL